MKTVLFDASVHLGQLDTSNQVTRVWCKNKQVELSSKGSEDMVGLYTFNENGWMDRVIWDLDREPQDIFYPFMDLFYSVKEARGIPLDTATIIRLQELVNEYSHLPGSTLLTCAVAIEQKVDEVQSAYSEMQHRDVQAILQSNNIPLAAPVQEEEKVFTEEGLEELYQAALKMFQQEQIVVTSPLTMGEW